MAYLGYKNKAFMNYKREQERIKMWKAEQARKRKKFREWKNITTTSILQLVVVALIIVFYGVFAIGVMAKDTVKVGEGPFVMAVSYTESYKDLQYIANFRNCELAQAYYDNNCTKAYIMMCQLEDKMYMPINHNTNYEFSSFDFEIDTTQSCGFVGLEKPKFTGVK